MSELQFVHFLALDRPLSDEQLEYMEQQSSRAEITPREFHNTYHYGDFRGNAAEMLRRGYDIHLHYANFGTRRLMFRLPEGLPWKKPLFKAFLPKFGVKWIADKSGEGGTLDFSPECDQDDWEELLEDELNDWLDAIAPARERLMAGDLRPLYLAWLAGSSDPKAIEPPVPAGLKNLPDDLHRLAAFFNLDVDLIEVAGQPSPPAVELDLASVVKKWITEQPVPDLRKLVAGLLGDESDDIRRKTIAAVREQEGFLVWPVVKAGRSLGELLEFAKDLSEVRIEQETAKQQAERAAKLRQLAKFPDKAIRQAGELARQRTNQAYHEAATLLADLRDALGPVNGPQVAEAAARELKASLPRGALLAGTLRQHGLLPPKRT